MQIRLVINWPEIGWAQSFHLSLKSRQPILDIVTRDGKMQGESKKVRCCWFWRRRTVQQVKEFKWLLEAVKILELDYPLYSPKGNSALGQLEFSLVRSMLDFILQNQKIMHMCCFELQIYVICYGINGKLMHCTSKSEEIHIVPWGLLLCNRLAEMLTETGPVSSICLFSPQRMEEIGHQIFYQKVFEKQRATALLPGKENKWVFQLTSLKDKGWSWGRPSLTWTDTQAQNSAVPMCTEINCWHFISLLFSNQLHEC